MGEKWAVNEGKAGKAGKAEKTRGTRGKDSVPCKSLARRIK